MVNNNFGKIYAYFQKVPFVFTGQVRNSLVPKTKRIAW